MRVSDIDALQRLHDLKSKGIVTESEYERKKIEILSAQTSLAETLPPVPVQDTKLAHGVSLLVGAVILTLITLSLLSDDQSSQSDLQEALGMIFLFGLWLIPHSIWLLTRTGANIILPIIALVLIGICGLVYVGSL